ncbi:MAG: CARDB domain-containing protein [Thermodesulfobacteriota bacterium]|nr:CARDB domain-containing protein [Thermodesulfobacteriota bacterium]
MKKLLLTLILLLSLISPQVWAGCGTIQGGLENLSIHFPCADLMSSRFNISLSRFYNAQDSQNLYFRLNSIEAASPGTTSSAFVSSETNHWDIQVYCAEYAGINYALTLEYQGTGISGLYWKLTGITQAGTTENHRPIAEPISLSVYSTVPYIHQQLSGRDPDNDTILYELASPVSGTGYADAYVNPNTGMLYLTHEPSGNDTFSISYRVTDGMLYSDAAAVTIQVTYLSEEDKETGKNDIEPKDYAEFKLSTYYSDLLGAINSDPSQPRSVDLSSNFPSPGDQGRQSSCVGWAVAYALKSYQEKVEIGWALNTPSHLFSPAFLYNQINYGRDEGSYINEALDLIVNKGTATLNTMPYSHQDYLTQPSSSAFSEASLYKAVSWSRAEGTSPIKAALANKKAVVAGIKVYQSLMNLKGENSVYNTKEGQDLGGHAVTIVGYDDSRYNGAFKVINSWSQNWGDNGFFWLPYDFAAQEILSEAYVLEDAENQTTPDPEDPTIPEPDYSTLPNLTIETWDASYDPRPRGTGTLNYTVKNTGTGTAPAGAEINLMLSANQKITSSDYYIIYERIPFELEPGESAFRDEAKGNSISFQFPDQLEQGTYYMALWVDDLDMIAESNENDNISIGDHTISITSSLPDLNVNTWYAEWDYYGIGTLTYNVYNTGNGTVTNTDWDINLILDRDQVIGNGNEIILFYESAGYPLEPDHSIYRDYFSAAEFNLYQDFFGSSVPRGTYYMALWVDDLNTVNESNELNNGSYSWGTVAVYGYGTASTKAERYSNTEIYRENSLNGRAYNGKKLPSEYQILGKVKISEDRYDISGSPVSDTKNQAIKKLEQNDLKPKKKISAYSSLVFPSSEKNAMPCKGNLNEK